MVKVQRVCCQGCGSPLGIDEDTRYVSCNHCGSNLEVIHDESSTRTRLLQQLGDATEQLSRQVRLLKLQNDLDRLEREWDRFRDSVLARSSDGRLIEPSPVEWKPLGWVAIVMGGSVLVATIAWGGAFGFIGLGVVILGAICLLRDDSSAGEFHHTKNRYIARREELRQAIDREMGVA